MIRISAALLMFAGSAALAADPKPDASLNQTISDSLRELHDRGAELYNKFGDHSGAYRLYEGALLAVKPLLGNRPDVQKTIADGVKTAALEPVAGQRAFLLHDTIEKGRAELKPAAKGKEPTPKTKIEPTPKPKTTEPTPKPKTTEPKPKATAKSIGVSGKVSVKGKALEAGTITFVSLDKKSPKVVSVPVKNGTYSVKELPAAKYAVAVTSDKPGDVPAKFTTTDTSGLTYQAGADAPGTLDVDLK